jgi:hypothetical protein
MRDLDDVFDQLQTSSFRRRFHLRPVERRYVKEKGFATVLDHAGDFIAARLAPAAIARWLRAELAGDANSTETR